MLLNRGRVDDLLFFEYLSTICFLSIEYHCTFSISYKILPYFVYYYCIFRLGSDKLSPVSSTVFPKAPRLVVILIRSVRTSFRVLASTFRLLLFRLCSNRCAEAMVVYRNCLLNRLTAV